VSKHLNYTLSEREVRNLSDQIVGLLNLVHPEWTYWENGTNGLRSKLSLAPLNDTRESCRSIDWRLTKENSTAILVFSACKGKFHWTFDLTPVSTKPEAIVPNSEDAPSPTNVAPKLSAAAPSVVILQFVNKTNEPVNVFWDVGNGVLTKYAEIQVGGSYSVQTYAGHTWKVLSGSGREYLRFTPDSSMKLSRVEVVPE